MRGAASAVSGAADSGDVGARMSSRGRSGCGWASATKTFGLGRVFLLLVLAFLAKRLDPRFGIVLSVSVGAKAAGGRGLWSGSCLRSLLVLFDHSAGCIDDDTGGVFNPKFMGVEHEMIEERVEGRRAKSLVEIP